MRDTAIDLALPLKLFVRELPLEARTDQEFIFGVIDVSHLAPMLDDVEIGVGIRIFRNSLQSIEQTARVNANEAIDTYVADIRRLTSDAICYIAVFFDLLPAWAMIELFRDLNTH